MLRECDYSQALLEQVNQAISDKTPLVIQGSNSKALLGRPVTGQTLDVRCHRGIVNYDPTELVITARAGTPLVAIEAALESAGQMLPCEPPHYGEEATWGGMVACGLAGPRRPWSGSVRDFVLGTRIITGAGKHLRFGGEVMKNVAGYDLSRLMAGSYGCLGVLTEISMKVLPRPRATLSLRREISLQEAMNEIAQWQLQPLPISGLCYFDNALWIRLEGGEGSVKAARELLGGEEVAGQFWQQLREQQLPFFSLPGTLWRSGGRGLAFTVSAGSFALTCSGKNGRSTSPTCVSARKTAGRGTTWRNPSRSIRSGSGRFTFCSTISRPISSKL